MSTPPETAPSPDAPGTLSGMWKGSSDQLSLTDVVDGTRTDLFADFDRDPLGRHDLELQLLVSGVRGSARIPRLVLARQEHGRWVVIEVTDRRGGAPLLVTPRVFDELRDAERFVFALRVQLLAALEQDSEVAP
jgi:hypothetical protein